MGECGGPGHGCEIKTNFQETAWVDVHLIHMACDKGEWLVVLKR